MKRKETQDAEERRKQYRRNHHERERECIAGKRIREEHDVNTYIKVYYLYQGVY